MFSQQKFILWRDDPKYRQLFRMIQPESDQVIWQGREHIYDFYPCASLIPTSDILNVTVMLCDFE